MVSAETYLTGGVRSPEAHLITDCLGGRKGIRRTESVGTLRDRSPQDLAMEESQDGSCSEETGFERHGGRHWAPLGDRLSLGYEHQA
jgi:hypothetical protein